MKKLIILILLVAVIPNAFGQKYKSKNAKKYGEWIMRYHEKPEPEILFSAFEAGVSSKQIAEAGSRLLIVSFFGSLFRADSTLINELYEKVKTNSTVNNHFGFVGALWTANTDYSKRIMSEYLKLEIAAKYKSDGSEKKEPFNIYSDEITDASQLDLIWADFFATANPQDIRRIISALPEKNEISQPAEWSLTSNGSRYKKVFQVIEAESKSTDNMVIKKKLISMISEIKK